MTIPDGAHQPNGYSGPSFPQPHPNSDYPPSYLQLSDVRTGSKRKRANTTSTTASLSTPPSAEIGVHVAEGFDRCIFDDPAGFCNMQNLCVDCVVDCDDANCQATSTEKCTDQCIVVPCNDQNSCHSVCTEEPCYIENCDGGEQCLGILDESLQLLCCTDYHDCHHDCHGCHEASSQIDWDCTLDDILGINGCNYGLSGCSQFPSSNSHVTSIHSVPALTHTQNNLPNFAATPQDNGLALSASSGSAVATPVESQLSETQVSRSIPNQNATNEFVCRWLGCNASFNSLNELVGHVNLAHLRPPSPLSQPSKKPRLYNDTTNSTQDILPLSCRWDDCHLYPDASALPGPSTGLQPEMAFDLLSSHFFHDHLGLSVPPPSQLPSLFQDVGTSANEDTSLNQTQNSGSAVPLPRVEVDPTASNSQSNPSPKENKTIQADKPAEQPSYATPASSPPPDTINPSTLSPHDCSQSTHICHWRSCGLSFPTCAALTEHLAQAHVGSGKGHYDCHWGDCTRNGSHGFASKQKIMRHLQAHTGHRPFVCKECGQHFSEAATLAQHMRRHTQEKPFVCDFPGCGKAFAITGALTIHKRTHNGERPFQCPHCERAFAESSNLSKHLRTHTGDRPYRCPEPGCGKAFARPDQLQRHGNVHSKKRSGSSSSPDGSGAGGNVDMERAKSGEAIVVK